MKRKKCLNWFFSISTAGSGISDSILVTSNFLAAKPPCPGAAIWEKEERSELKMFQSKCLCFKIDREELAMTTKKARKTLIIDQEEFLPKSCYSWILLADFQPQICMDILKYLPKNSTNKALRVVVRASHLGLPVQIPALTKDIQVWH